MTQQPKTMDVFFEYVSQRKAGGTKAAAINEVQPLAQELTNGERAQLGQLIQIWEAHEGKPRKRYRQRQFLAMIWR